MAVKKRRSLILSVGDNVLLRMLPTSLSLGGRSRGLFMEVRRTLRVKWKRSPMSSNCLFIWRSLHSAKQASSFRINCQHKTRETANAIEATCKSSPLCFFYDLIQPTRFLVDFLFLIWTLKRVFNCKLLPGTEWTYYINYLYKSKV